MMTMPGSLRRPLATVNQLFKKILCPIDFDGQAAAALELAARIARQIDAAVYVVHVVSADAQAERGWQKGEAVQLEKMADEKLTGLAHDFIVRSGAAQLEVLNAVADLGADLIVMPTHGHAGLKRLVLGSVAEQVIRKSPVPVLTLVPLAAAEK
jgi:universal stress protein A